MDSKDNHDTKMQKNDVISRNRAK